MQLYHVTSPERGKAIEREGFRDNDTFFGGQGVWLADVPLDCNDFGAGEWESDEYVLAIDVPDGWLDERWEVRQEGEGKGYREWCIPAPKLNTLPVAASGDRDDERFHDVIVTRFTA